MSPITARATEIRVLQYHTHQLSILLSRLDQGLLLCGHNPETHHVRQHLVETLRVSHGQIGTLTSAHYAEQAKAAAEQYADSRGGTP